MEDGVRVGDWRSRRGSVSTVVIWVRAGSGGNGHRNHFYPRIHTGRRLQVVRTRTDDSSNMCGVRVTTNDGISVGVCDLALPAIAARNVSSSDNIVLKIVVQKIRVYRYAGINDVNLACATSFDFSVGGYPSPGLGLNSLPSANRNIVPRRSWANAERRQAVIRYFFNTHVFSQPRNLRWRHKCRDTISCPTCQPATRKIVLLFEISNQI